MRSLSSKHPGGSLGNLRSINGAMCGVGGGVGEVVHLPFTFANVSFSTLVARLFL